MPRSRATCAIGFPVSTTSCTAPRLKSSSNFRRVSAIALTSSKAMSPRYGGKPSYRSIELNSTPCQGHGTPTRVRHHRKERSMTSTEDEFSASNPEVLEAVLHRKNRPINVIAGTIGRFVEWYDWYIYGLR